MWYICGNEPILIKRLQYNGKDKAVTFAIVGYQ